MTEHLAQRVGVLADSQNLYHTALNIHDGANIDYNALLQHAVAGRQLVRAIAYVIKADNKDEQKFFSALDHIGFETQVKDIKEYGDGTKKADWDVGMSLDAVSLADHVDVIVLCTGDGDFVRLCRHLRHEGVRIEVVSFRESTSTELVDVADRFVNMSTDDTFLL